MRYPMFRLGRYGLAPLLAVALGCGSQSPAAGASDAAAPDAPSHVKNDGSASDASRHPGHDGSAQDASVDTGVDAAPPAPVYVNTVFLAQTQEGAGTGADCADALAATYLGDATKWSATPAGALLGPDTLVELCGTINQTLTFAGSGAAGHPVTVACASAGCSLSQPVGQAVAFNGQSYIVLDGGSACGPSVDGSKCTGIIENTANGTGLANQKSIQAFGGFDGSGSIEIKNWMIRNFYAHAAPAAVDSISCVGTACTATLAGPVPYASGEAGVSIGGSSLTAANNLAGPAYTVGTVSGNTFTFTTPSDATGTGTGGMTSEASIDQTLDCIIYANGAGAQLSFHDSTVHDVGWAILYSQTGGTATLDVHDVHFYNYDHGVVPATKVAWIHDNRLGTTSSWDTVNDVYHHDGVHCFGTNNSSACTTDLRIWNNLYDGDWGGNTTAHNYFEASPPDLEVYNNIHLQHAGNTIPDAMDSLSMTTGLVANNVYVCDPTVPNAAGVSLSGTAITVVNNAFYGCNVFLSASSGTTFTRIDYNAYMAQGMGGDGAWGIPDAGYASAAGQSGFLNIVGTMASATNYPNFQFARYDGPITINGAAYEVASLDSEWAMTLTTSVAGLQTAAPYALRGIDVWRSTSGMEAHSSYSTTDGLKADGTPTTSSALIGAGDDLSARCSALPDLCKTSSGGGKVAPVTRPNGHWNIGAY